MSAVPKGDELGDDIPALSARGLLSRNDYLIAAWAERQTSEAQFLQGRREEALASARRACELAPHDPVYHLWSCQVLAALDRFEEAAAALDLAAATGLDAAVEGWHRKELARQSSSRRNGVIYEDADLLVRHVRSGRSRTLVVTFAHVRDDQHKMLPGFAETFLKTTDYDAIYFTCADNAWYQYAGISDAVAKAREVARSYDRVICYGSSMGAYGAYRYADALGAHLVIADAPQFTPDPRASPFDKRWASETAVSGFRYEAPPPRVCDSFIVLFDPRDFDAMHVAELRRLYPLMEVALPFAGHDVATTLAKAGLLGTVARQLFAGLIAPEAIPALFREHRRRSPHYFMNMGHATKALGRKLWLFRKAVSLAPRDGGLHCLVGDVLWRHGDLAGARDAYARAAELQPEDPWPTFLVQDADHALGTHGHTAPSASASTPLRRPPLPKVARRLMWFERFNEAVQAIEEGVANGFDATEGEALLGDIAWLKDDRRRRLALQRLRTARAEPDASRRLALLQDAAREDPDGAVYRLLGEVLVELGEISAAADAFRAATEVDPDHAWSWKQLCEALHATGCVDEALQAAERALQLGGSDPAFTPLQLSMLIVQARLEEAEACIASAAERGFPADDLDWWRSEVQRRRDQMRREDASDLMKQAEAEARAALPAAVEQEADSDLDGLRDLLARIGPEASGSAEGHGAGAGPAGASDAGC